MCQLLGMNCNVPTDICFSFTGLQARGGLTDDHTDGWGIAFFEGKGVRLFLDPNPSVNSPIAELVKTYPIHSKNVIAHIRKATLGAVGLENTHPFRRELWGMYWVFAHNGTLKNFSPSLDGNFLPVGETDSELAFCWILQELRRQFGVKRPTKVLLFDAIKELVAIISKLGAFNFLLSNGELLYAHCSTNLSYLIRQAPFSEAHLKDQDIAIDFSRKARAEDRVVVIATQPLTDNESWTTMTPESFWWFEDGALVRHIQA
ncbi:MAG: class II glutamine amidotransferase [Bdellovibrionaceae bacterium]|nr:class II glutamine amidotransferase [Pseudobdellovibrionaceae bacterium]